MYQDIVAWLAPRLMIYTGKLVTENRSLQQQMQENVKARELGDTKIQSLLELLDDVCGVMLL